MIQYINKGALVAEIEKRYEYWREKEHNSHSIESEIRMSECQHLILLFNTLEVKEVDFWHKQFEEDIDNSFNDWSLHRFICLMKDGSIQEFTAIQDECYDGSINLHLDCVDDEYNWEYDDIMYWIEVPNIKAQKG